MKTTLRPVTANITAAVRRVTHLGRKYLVAPLTMIVPGVLPGSKGPLLYPPDEVADNPQAWNGMPIVVGHPKVNGRHVSARSPDVIEQYGIGHVYGARYKDKLVAEGWFDEELTKNKAPVTYRKLLAGKPGELSTGLFTDDYPVRNGEGVHTDGRRYTHVARNYRPDHLAVLEDVPGACSVKDGCGLNVNQLLNNVFCPTGKGGGVDPSCSKGGKGGGSGKPTKLGSVKSLSKKATETLKQAAAADKAGDKNKARNLRAAAHGYNRAAKHVEDGDKKAAAAVLKVADDFAQGRRGLGGSDSKPSAPMPPSPSGSSGRKLVPPTDKIPMEDKPSKQKAAKVPTAEKKARGSTEAGKKVMDYAKSVLAKDARPMEVDVHRMNRELQKMTVPQLKDLQKQFMGKHGGKVKADRVKSLVDLVSGRVKVQVPKVDRGTGRQGLEQKATLWSDVKDAFRHLMRGGDVFGNAKADEPQAADSLTTAEVIAALLQLRADGDNIGAGKLVRLIESYTDAPEEDADSEEPPTDNRKRRKKGKSSIPSRGLDMTPDKACKILKDGTVHGKPLTSRQRGMFGAKCGERGPKQNSVTVPSLRSRP